MIWKGVMFSLLIACLKCLALVIAPDPMEYPDEAALPTLSSLLCLGDCRLSFDGTSALVIAPDAAAFIHLQQNHLMEMERALLTDCPGAWLVLVSPEGMRIATLPMEVGHPDARD